MSETEKETQTETQTVTKEEKKTKEKGLDTPAKELSDSDIRFREKYKNLKQEHEAEKIQAEKERTALTSKTEAITKEKTVMEQKWLEAELKAEATAAGITDMDFAKLIDITGAKVVDGNVTGIKEAVEAFKAKKPQLFGTEKKTSSSAGAERQGGEQTRVQLKDAWDYSEADFKNKIRELTSRRYARR